jgi:hypothetical protein
MPAPAEGRGRHVTNETLREWFGFHPADTERKRNAHQTVRLTHYALAQELNELLPEGPEKTLALRALQDAAMKANASLAIGGGPREEYEFGAHVAVRLVALLEEHYPGDPTSPVA